MSQIKNTCNITCKKLSGCITCLRDTLFLAILHQNNSRLKSYQRAVMYQIAQTLGSGPGGGRTLLSPHPTREERGRKRRGKERRSLSEVMLPSPGIWRRWKPISHQTTSTSFQFLSLLLRLRNSFRNSLTLWIRSAITVLGFFFLVFAGEEKCCTGEGSTATLSPPNAPEEEVIDAEMRLPRGTRHSQPSIPPAYAYFLTTTTTSPPVAHSIPAPFSPSMPAFIGHPTCPQVPSSSASPGAHCAPHQHPLPKPWQHRGHSATQLLVYRDQRASRGGGGPWYTGSCVAKRRLFYLICTVNL